MPRQKYNDTVKLEVTCGKCGFIFPADMINVSSSSQDCELCGSHGEIDVDVECLGCHRMIMIKVREW